jgi:TolB protein
LAYVAERDGNLDIWVLVVDGSGAYRLTDSPAKDWAPAWSPDGSQLAFVSDRGGSHQIYAMQADGSGPRLLSDVSLGAEGPAWSPDGFWLAFVAYTGEASGIRGREIHLMRSDGQNQVRLTFNGADDTEVEWLVGTE